jgi:hypothetical protein
MAGLTTYSFDGGASTDKNKDKLDYVWNFGDGSAGNGRTVTHVYRSPGSYPVSLVVYDGKKEATAGGSTLTINRDLVGTWRGSFKDQYAATYNVTIAMKQSAQWLYGTYQDDKGAGGVNGSISSSTYVCPCTVSFTVTQTSYQPFSFSGTIQAGSSTMTGTVSGSGVGGASLTLTRVQ